MAPSKVLLATSAVGAAVLLSPSCFVPGALRSSVAPTAVHAGVASETGSSVPLLCAAAAATSAVAAVVSRTSRRAVRRDLSVALNEAGVDLSDNGKFAQGLIGADGAWGRYEFDPLGLAKNNTEWVAWYREAELKHGRVAMLAWVGLVVPDFIRVYPGDLYSFEHIPRSILAHDILIQDAYKPLAQILIPIHIVEICCLKKVLEWNSRETAGDYGLGAQFLPKDEEGQKQMRMKELKNGRLAMIAFGGAVTQALISGHSFPWLY